jgi:hypothetical protein
MALMGPVVGERVTTGPVQVLVSKRAQAAAQGVFIREGK